MNPFEILYTCSTTVAVIASVPQVRQLIISKRSDELSVPTWSLWLATQVVSLTYMISIRERLLIIVSSIWLVFYVIMMALIMYYRRNPGGPAPRQSMQLQEALVEE